VDGKGEVIEEIWPESLKTMALNSTVSSGGPFAAPVELTFIGLVEVQVGGPEQADKGDCPAAMLE
jgi:hypothetical protein